MKNLHTKLKNHGKKVIIHLKRHHRKYLFGALCSGILALIGIHTASTINSTFADEEPVNPSITYDSNANITYIDTEGREFTGIGTITISNGEYSITMLDRNLGATTNNINDTGSYGYHFQWGNNYGFDPFDVSVEDNAISERVDASGYGPGNYFFSGVFRKIMRDWSSSRNDNLRGGGRDSQENNRGLDSNTEITDRQGPCPEGYHVPSLGEWSKTLEYWVEENKDLIPDERLVYHENGSFSLANNVYICYDENGHKTECVPEGNVDMEYLNYDNEFLLKIQQDLKIPFAGLRGNDSAQIGVMGIDAHLWSSSPATLGFDSARSFDLHTGGAGTTVSAGRAFAFSVRCFKNPEDVVSPTCDVEYSTTGPTNQDVVAYLTGCSEEITTEETGYTFTGNGTHTFEFEDLAGNSGEAIATVDQIDKVAPNCSIEYSTTGPTNQNVIATLTCDDADIVIANNGGLIDYTFESTGSFTFEFQDLAGNTGSTEATVTWIDKVKPTCDIIYSTTGATTGNVVATLTGCIETITGTETQHTFTGNGTYIFNFQDLAGNTGSTEAAVTWIGEYTGVYEIKSGQQMINLYNQGKAITCNVIYSGDNGHQTNTMYIKSGVINENLMIITGNTRTMLYSLEKDGYIYSWGDMYLDGIGFYIPYELDVYEELKGVDNNIKSGAIITCTTGVEEDSVFDLPDGVDFFNIDTYYIDSGVYFIIDAKETAKTGENIDFTITVMKDGKRFKNFLGYVLIDVIDEDGDLLDKNTYEAPGYGYYYFASSDKGKKTFSNGLKINKTGDYYIRVNSLQEGEGFFPISIKGKNDPTLTGNYFKITVNSKANPGEYTTFTVRAMKDGISYSNYTGTVIFTLSKKDGSLVNKRNYTFSNSGRYTFEASDLGRKIFYSGLKINETGTYILEVNGLNDNFKGSTTINVGKSHGSAEFKYDTLKFNPKYSDEMNEAYQYARYYDITTKDSIKDADMYSGLNRIAMAKMLTNYAENVLGKDNFNTGRNCSFNDVSNSLDKDYDYGVTKACQLGIMGVNMPNNKFYPNGGVTRAEFATALSRLLYGTKDGTEKYYSTHITKLRREGIITNTDPALWELRGYVMLMLKRVAEK